MTDKPLTQDDEPIITVTPEHAAEYNKRAREWAQERGLPPPEEIVAGTSTLCPVSTTTITNTPNSDDHVDQITDQSTDDSGNG